MENPVATFGEDRIYQRGDSMLYMCRHEWRGIVLGEQDPREIVAALPWRVPTKEEAKVLHMFTIDAPSHERYLAVDEDGVWWSFLFGSGNVTKAGMKTKYTLRPVRWQVTERDTIVPLGVAK